MKVKDWLEAGTWRSLDKLRKAFDTHATSVLLRDFASDKINPDFATDLLVIALYGLWPWSFCNLNFCCPSSHIISFWTLFLDRSLSTITFRYCCWSKPKYKPSTVQDGHFDHSSIEPGLSLVFVPWRHVSSHAISTRGGL